MKGPRTAGCLWGALAVLLALDIVGVALTWAPADWNPVWLVLLLTCAAAVSELGSIPLKGMQVSSSVLPLVLAMVLLGPVPAAAIGLVTVAVDGLVRRTHGIASLINVATSVGYPLVGGIAFLSWSGVGLSMPRRRWRAQCSVSPWRATSSTSC